MLVETQTQARTVEQPQVPAQKVPRQGGHRVVMLGENNYPQDTRVRNEARCMTEAGYEVTVVCLRKGDQPRVEEVDRVAVYRVPRIGVFRKVPATGAGRRRSFLIRVKAFIGYCAEYVYFTSACLGVTTYLLVKKGFDVLHAHNPPDTLFVVGALVRLLGKKFVFDQHDLCPELYRSRYGAGEGFLTRMLGVCEWCSLKLAHVTIATNESYRRVQVERGGKRPSTVFVVRNGPDERWMTPGVPSPRLRAMNKQILCYVGSLNPQDGVDYLLRALAHLRWKLRRTDFVCVIIGSGDSLEDLRRLTLELRLEGCVELPGYVSDAELRACLAAADICVDPDPSSPLNDVSTWIKIMEYMACAKPIVTFDLKETRFSAQDAAAYVPPNDECAFADAINQLMDQPERREAMGVAGRQRVERDLQWSVVRKHLIQAYEFLQ